MLDWWRRRRAGNDGEGTGTYAVRGEDEATRMVESSTEPHGRAADGGTMVVTALETPQRGGERKKPAPHLAATQVESAMPGPGTRARVVGVVVAVEGEFEGRAFPLVEGMNRLGREHVCEICLPSERVAPQHASIEYRSGFFRLERIAETELRVNFEPTERTLLRDGDYLQIGMTTLRFRSIVGA